MAAIDETGNKYGKLTVLKRDYSKPKSQKNCYWLCKCDCGNTAIVIGTKLRNGETKSCGCLRKTVNSKNTIDMLNQKFGRLTVVARDGSTSSGIAKWRCKCDCGKIITVIGSHLRNGHTTSCGCAHKEIISQINRHDITNQKFGKLTAICPLQKRKGTNTIWKCKCDCGKYCEVDINSLTQGKTNSCGCLGKSKGEYIISQILMQYHIPFEKQKTFETCRSPKTNRLFRFDFFVNNQYLIEFDGEQHFNYTGSGWNTKEHFEETKYNDNFKNQWCKKNNIPLIRIPYTHIDKISLVDLILNTSKYIII